MKEVGSKEVFYSFSLVNHVLLFFRFACFHQKNQDYRHQALKARKAIHPSIHHLFAQVDGEIWKTGHHLLPHHG